ncbi:uncharacterized protein P884DRAFT_133457 [Thermothelomyces heterothallicus CBS 202.75]|uniref:uncharacterized protein n=1 Tax=Thermothelomyces heterothallicus CBS 202.75 TaxID=1149848 RepID=UPI003743F49A
MWFWGVGGVLIRSVFCTLDELIEEACMAWHDFTDQDPPFFFFFLVLVFPIFVSVERKKKERTPWEADFLLFLCSIGRFPGSMGGRYTDRLRHERDLHTARPRSRERSDSLMTMPLFLPLLSLPYLVAIQA